MPLVLNGATSGSTTVQATDAVTATLTLPSATGTLLSTANPQSGGVIQVVQGTTSTQVSSGATWTDTGLSVSITPKFSTSKILVIVGQNVYTTYASSSSYGGLRLLRGASTIYNPTQVDANGPFMFGAGIGNSTTMTLYGFASFSYLDSPATTSSTTYKTQQSSYQAGMTFYTQGAAGVNNATSTITLMEIAA